MGVGAEYTQASTPYFVLFAKTEEGTIRNNQKQKGKHEKKESHHRKRLDFFLVFVNHTAGCSSSRCIIVAHCLFPTGMGDYRLWH